MRKACEEKQTKIFTRTPMENVLHTHRQLKDVRQIQEMLAFQFMHKQSTCFNKKSSCRMLI